MAQTVDLSTADTLAKGTQADISVVICTKDRQQDCLECVASVLAQTVQPHELIIVDASQSDELISHVRQLLLPFPNVKFVYLASRPSLTQQRNSAIDYVSGAIVLFLDDDVVLDRDHIRRLLEVYELKRDEQIGGVQGSGVESTQHSCLARIFRRLFLLPYRADDGLGKLLPSGNPSFIQTPSAITPVEILWGADMSYLRHILQKYRFDENLSTYAYMEDVDFSYRVSREYRLYQTPHARFMHKRSTMSRSNLEQWYAMVVFNSWYIFRKNINKSLTTWLSWWWSNVGHALLCFWDVLRARYWRALCGLLKGYGHIVSAYLP